MKAKDLAEWLLELTEWLLEHPDFDVVVCKKDDGDGWPSYSRFNIEPGDICYSSKTISLDIIDDSEKIFNQLIPGKTVYSVFDDEKSSSKVIYVGELVSLSKDKNSVMFYVRYDNGLTYWHDYSDFNSNVFYSLEDAKNIIKKKE